ncbi:MAG: class I SAM-dependent methyltransferase [Nitrospinota bacterium]|nr:class I SAM-dependent methyltransferase [Nitrospinota bacterium]
MSNASQGKVWQDPRQAASYLAHARGAIPLAAEQLRLAVGLAETMATKVERILDLGCGDGVMGMAMVERWPGATLTLADFSDTMLTAASQRAEAAGVDANLVNLDYSDPSWPSLVSGRGSFDLVVSGFSIHHQTGGRKEEVYQEVFGLLTTGGVFLNLDNVSSPTEKLARFFELDFVDALVSERVHKGLAADREAIFGEWWTRRKEDLACCSPLEDQLGWLRDIGFENVDCYFKYLEFALFGGSRPMAGI